MIHIVGAGPGDKNLITVRGKELLEAADVVIYAGSLVPKELLAWCRKDASLYDSSGMTLEEVVSVMKQESLKGHEVVRLHTGDPSIYGAIREQMDDLLRDPGASHILGASGIEIVPGVSSFTAAAAALGVEYTLPGISQSIIITRMEGRTPVPEREKLKELGRHGASMAVFLSASMTKQVSEELLSSGGYDAKTPAAIVYAVTHGDEKIVRCTLGELESAAVSAGISKTALILVGDFLAGDGVYEKSRLYAHDFSTGYRKGSDDCPIRCISFTEGGRKVGLRLKEAFGDELDPVPFDKGMSLEDWTASAFREAKAVVFIGAAGIAVRAVASFLRSKALDPAVIVVDDRGENVIPILSGHIGGGNALAKRIAGVLGGRAVITTSTDINGVFAIDSWAAERGLKIINPERIRAVSSKLLRGEKVSVCSYVNISGEMPDGLARYEDKGDGIGPDVVISTNNVKYDSALQIVVPAFIIGTGCRKGISALKVKEAFGKFCEENSICREAVAGIASIDLKKDEEALHALADDLGVGFAVFSGGELNDIGGIEGGFSSSDFVESVTGVDCVCERSAIKASGADRLFARKWTGDGVTFAAAVACRELSW